MKILRKLLTFCIVVGAFFAFMFVAQAAEIGGFGAYPLEPTNDDPALQDWFVYELEEGAVHEDAVVVQNNTSDSVSLYVYAADSVRSTDGGFAVKQRVEDRNAVGSWITLEKGQVELGPHQNEVIPFTIQMPEAGTIDVGEHTGGIMVEKVPDPATADAGGIQLSLRSGVRVYITVPGEIIKKLSLAGMDTVYNKSSKSFITSFSVENEGNVSRMARMDLFIEDDLFGKPTQEFTNEAYSVLRGDTATVNFDWEKPFFGKFTVYGTVTYEDDTGEVVLETEKTTVQTYPESISLLVLLIAGAILALVILYLLLRWIFGGFFAGKYQVKSGDTLLSVAERLDVPAKKLVRMNKLKRPYSLRGKKFIKAPRKSLKKLERYKQEQRLKKEASKAKTKPKVTPKKKS